MTATSPLADALRVFAADIPDECWHYLKAAGDVAD